MKVGVVVAVLLAAGASAAGATTATGSNRQVARTEVVRALESLSLPPGSVRSASDPAGGALAVVAVRPLTPRLIDRHTFWRAPDSPQPLMAWIRAHLPARSRVVGMGEESGPRGPTVRLLQLSFSSAPAGVQSSSLVISTAPLHGGRSAVRVDSEVVWRLDRPAWAVVPSGVRSIKVTVTRPGSPSSSPIAITAPGRVARIVRLVNRLQVWQLDGGTVACPADMGPLVRIAFFRHARDRTPVAVAMADGSGCRTVELVVHGRTAPTLTGGPRLISALGVH